MQPFEFVVSVEWLGSLDNVAIDSQMTNQFLNVNTKTSMVPPQKLIDDG